MCYLHVNICIFYKKQPLFTVPPEPNQEFMLCSRHNYCNLEEIDIIFGSWLEFMHFNGKISMPK